MNELSLFTGAGGGILGTYLLGFRPIGYVEWDGYCQRVLAQRIKDGILHEAPIFCDVRAFIGEGYAASYTGMVDVLTAGFPCQPFSGAGKRKGVDDERNMWPATADVIRIVRPRFVLLENVPGIREYLPVVLRDLRRLGYTVRRPLILGADDVGAPHRRKRIWIVAHAESDGWESRRTERTGQQGRTSFVGAGILADAEMPECERSGYSRTGRDGFTDSREDVPHANGEHGKRRPESQQPIGESGTAWVEPERCGDDDADTFNDGSHRTEGNASEPCSNGKDNRLSFGNREWPVEPDVGRVAHGVASRVDRLKAIGNGQVPRVVATAWEILST